MADTKISALTDRATVVSTDRFPLAYSPFAAGNNAYATPVELGTFLAGNFLGTATLAGGTLITSQPLTLTQTWNAGAVVFNGLLVNITNTASDPQSMLMALQAGGTSVVTARTDGQFYVAGTLTTGASFSIGFRNADTIAAAPDVTFFRDGADTLALRRSTNAQIMRGYRTFTDVSNYERWGLQSGAGYFELAAESAGTGTANIDLRLTPKGTGLVTSVAGIKSAHATAGIGYATGAGGAVTQLTSRTTGVTLNTVTGAITLVSAAGSATPASFTVTNSAVAATDTVLVSQKSGADLYEIFVTAVAAGSFRITSFTTGGTTTEQPVFSFVVIKAVAA